MSLADSMRLVIAAARLLTISVPTKSQFFRPVVHGRIFRGVAAGWGAHGGVGTPQLWIVNRHPAGYDDPTTITIPIFAATRSLPTEGADLKRRLRNHVVGYRPAQLPRAPLALVAEYQPLRCTEADDAAVEPNVGDDEQQEERREDS